MEHGTHPPVSNDPSHFPANAWFPRETSHNTKAIINYEYVVVCVPILTHSTPCGSSRAPGSRLPQVHAAVTVHSQAARTRWHATQTLRHDTALGEDHVEPQESLPATGSQVQVMSRQPVIVLLMYYVLVGKRVACWGELQDLQKEEEPLKRKARR